MAAVSPAGPDPMMTTLWTFMPPRFLEDHGPRVKVARAAAPWLESLMARAGTKCPNPECRSDAGFEAVRESVARTNALLEFIRCGACKTAVAVLDTREALGLEAVKQLAQELKRLEH